MNDLPEFATTGWPGLEPGDNVVWSVEEIEDYRRLVVPYERAARLIGCRRVYFRFGTHPPLQEFFSNFHDLRFTPLSPDAPSARTFRCGV